MTRWKKTAGAVVVAAFLAWYAARNAAQFRQAAGLLRLAHMEPLLLAAAFQGLYYVCAGLVVRQCLRLVAFQAPFWWTVRSTFLLIFISRIVPGPAVSGPAAMYYLLEKRGLGRARSALVGPLFYAVDYGVFFLLFAAGLLLRGGLMWPALSIAAAIVTAMAFISRASVLTRVARAAARVVNGLSATFHLHWRVPETAAESVGATVGEMRERVGSQPGMALGLAGAGTAMLLCDVATMDFAFRAFGVVLSPAAALLGFCGATMGALVSFLPGGLGTFDAAMVAGFTALGAPRPAALAAAALYRLIATVFPALLGALSYRAFLEKRQAG